MQDFEFLCLSSADAVLNDQDLRPNGAFLHLEGCSTLCAPKTKTHACSCQPHVQLASQLDSEDSVFTVLGHLPLRLGPHTGRCGFYLSLCASGAGSGSCLPSRLP